MSILSGLLFNLIMLSAIWLVFVWVKTWENGVYKQISTLSKNISVGLSQNRVLKYYNIISMGWNVYSLISVC